jgi:hypothetical protein
LENGNVVFEPSWHFQIPGSNIAVCGDIVESNAIKKTNCDQEGKKLNKIKHVLFGSFDATKHVDRLYYKHCYQKSYWLYPY